MERGLKQNIMLMPGLCECICVRERERVSVCVREREVHLGFDHEEGAQTKYHAHARFVCNLG